MFGPMMGAGRDYQRTAEEEQRKHRERMAPIHKALGEIAKIPGVENVDTDDWDSAGVNVFVHLAGTKFKLAYRLQDTKRKIAKVLKQNRFYFSFSDQPAKSYSTYPSLNARPTGRGNQMDQGYNHRSIKLDVKFAQY